MWVNWSCKKQKISLESWTKNLPLYVVFIVRRVRGSLLTLKILKGSKGWRHNYIFRRKRASALDAGLTRGCLIVRNVKFPLAQLNEASIFAANVKNIPAMTWIGFSLQCLIGSSFGIILNESSQLGTNNGLWKFEKTIPVHGARPSTPPTTWNVESVVKSPVAITWLNTNRQSNNF